MLICFRRVFSPSGDALCFWSVLAEPIEGVLGRDFGGATCAEGPRIPLLGLPAATAACRFAAVGIAMPPLLRFLRGMGGSAVVGGPADGLGGRGMVVAMARCCCPSMNSPSEIQTKYQAQFWSVCRAPVLKQAGGPLQKILIKNQPFFLGPPGQ